MKKALTVSLLLLLAGAFLVMTGCNNEMEPIEVENFPTGSENVAFSGTEWSVTMPSYTTGVITKTTQTAGDDEATVEYIPTQQTVYTISFAADGTYEYSQVTTWLDAYDATYTDTATVTYSGDVDGTGFSGKTKSSTTITGDWESYTAKWDAENDAQTMQYWMQGTQKVQVSYSGSTATYSTADADTSTTTTQMTGSPDFIEYNALDPNDAGKQVVYIGDDSGAALNGMAMVYTQQ